jgi:hypothetical protein
MKKTPLTLRQKVDFRLFWLCFYFFVLLSALEAIDHLLIADSKLWAFCVIWAAGLAGTLYFIFSALRLRRANKNLN